MKVLSGIVEDVSSDPHSFAVIHDGRLLPVRFAKEWQAGQHLIDVQSDHYTPEGANQRLPRHSQPGEVYAKRANGRSAA